MIATVSSHIVGIKVHNISQKIVKKIRQGEAYEASDVENKSCRVKTITLENHTAEIKHIQLDNKNVSKHDQDSQVTSRDMKCCKISPDSLIQAWTS